MIGTTTYLIAIGRCRCFMEEFHDRSAIAPRSRFDRDAIVAKINRDHSSFITESSPRASSGIQWRIKITIVARSQLDRGPIVARSLVFLKQKLRPICHEIEATIVINGSSRLHDRSWPSIRLHDRIKRPKNRANFPL